MACRERGSQVRAANHQRRGSAARRLGNREPHLSQCVEPAEGDELGIGDVLLLRRCTCRIDRTIQASAMERNAKTTG
eukprot:5318694-Pleurochrysis_carterae.AAC.2